MEQVAGPRRRHPRSAALGGMSIAITAWSEFVQADRGVAYRIFESIGRSERPTRRPSELFSVIQLQWEAVMRTILSAIFVSAMLLASPSGAFAAGGYLQAS